MTPTSPLKAPTSNTLASADVAAAGLLIPPIERIRIFSARQWEEFVLEWVDSLRDQYGTVERCGGSGDMGRDIVAFDKANPVIWDNYQCKHYKTVLAPGDVWVELGKLVYYTHINEYTYPRKYSFVAPQGAGTRLSNLLRKADKLKVQLIENWEKHCKNGITSTATIELDATLRAYLDRLDFSIFEAVPPLRIIDQHAKTRWFVTRFGGGLPARPKMEVPPAKVADHEVIYVRRLLDAYGDHLKCSLQTVADLGAHDDVRDHFNDSRLEFYSAEALRAFSRDTLPIGAFEELQSQLHSGIKDEIRGTYPDGYQRVRSVIKTARLLPIADHALKERLSLLDKGGICHQLANDGKVKWVK